MLAADGRYAGLVASASAAAAAVTAATATTAASAATIFARLGFIDRKGAPRVLLPIQALDGRLRFRVVAHFDEAEAFAVAGVTICDDLGTFHRAIRTKQLLQLRAVHAVAQVPNIQFLTQGNSPYGQDGPLVTGLNLNTCKSSDSQ